MNCFVFFGFFPPQGEQQALLVLLLCGGAQTFVAFAVFRSRGGTSNGCWLTQ